MIDLSNITAQGPHVASTRSTKYEHRQTVVGPNSLGVVCAERGVFRSSPIPLELPESMLDQQVRVRFGGQVIEVTGSELVHAYQALVEECFRQLHDAKEEELQLKGIDVPRAVVHSLMREAEEAKSAVRAAQLETARIEAENIAKRAEAEELDRNLAVIRAAAGSTQEKSKAR